MAQHRLYRINSPQVISEVVDGEAIILNFESGCYFSLNESGMIIWDTLKRGNDKPATLIALQQHFGQIPESAASDIDLLINNLLQEQLLVSDADPDSASPALAAEALKPGSKYVAPELAKFNDLQELLLLDPIHDVDESGWPRQAD